MKEERKRALKVILRWYFYLFAILGWFLQLWQIVMAYIAYGVNAIYCIRYYTFIELYFELFFYIPLILIFMILYVIVDIKERNKKEREN